MDSIDLKYNKFHLECLMDEFVKAYKQLRYDDCVRIKKQISNLKELLNSNDRIISEHQIPKILEG